jgi:hypothetical protein
MSVPKRFDTSGTKSAFANADSTRLAPNVSENCVSVGLAAQ